MVRRGPGQEVIREYLRRRGDGLLHNVLWADPAVCPACTGIPAAGYERCKSCAGWCDRPDVADRLGFVTYAPRGTQAGHMMHADKNQRDAETVDLVRSLLTYAVVAHWDCVGSGAGGQPEAWACVPSLSGRPEPHALSRIAAGFMGNIPSLRRPH